MLIQRKKRYRRAKNIPVIVDFWANGVTSKQLTPVLEKTVMQMNGSKLVKVDIDKPKLSPTNANSICSDCACIF